MSGRTNGADVERLERALAELVSVSERAPRFVRFGDVQRELGCCKSHLRNLVQRGLIKAVKLDGLLLIDFESYAAYLDSATPIRPKVSR